MIDLQTFLWVLGFCLIIGILFGPGMWSDTWGWGVLDRLFKKKRSDPAAKPDDRGPGQP